MSVTEKVKENSSAFHQQKRHRWSWTLHSSALVVMSERTRSVQHALFLPEDTKDSSQELNLIALLGRVVNSFSAFDDPSGKHLKCQMVPLIIAS